MAAKEAIAAHARIEEFEKIARMVVPVKGPSEKPRRLNSPKRLRYRPLLSIDESWLTTESPEGKVIISPSVIIITLRAKESSE